MTSPPHQAASQPTEKPPDVVIPPPELRIPRAAPSSANRSSPWDGRRGGLTRRAHSRGRMRHPPVARQAHANTMNNNRSMGHPSGPATTTNAPPSTTPSSSLQQQQQAPVPNPQRASQPADRDPRRRPEHLRRRTEQNVSGNSMPAHASAITSTPLPPSSATRTPAASPSQGASLSSIIRAIPTPKESKRPRFQPFAVANIDDIDDIHNGHPPPLGAMESTASVADAFDPPPPRNGISIGGNKNKIARALPLTASAASNAKNSIISRSTGGSDIESSSPNARPDSSNASPFPSHPNRQSSTPLRKYNALPATGVTVPKSRPVPVSTPPTSGAASANLNKNNSTPRAPTLAYKPMTPLQRMAAQSRAKAAAAASANAIGSIETNAPQPVSEVATAKIERDKRLLSRRASISTPGTASGIQPPPRKTFARRSLPASSSSNKKISESIMKPISKKAKAVLNRNMKAQTTFNAAVIASASAAASTSTSSSDGQGPIVPPPPKKAKDFVVQNPKAQTTITLASPVGNHQRRQPPHPARSNGNANNSATPLRGPVSNAAGRNVVPTASNFARPKTPNRNSTNQTPSPNQMRLSSPKTPTDSSPRPVSSTRQVIMGPIAYPKTPAPIAIRSGPPPSITRTVPNANANASIAQLKQTLASPATTQAGKRNAAVAITSAQRQEMSMRASAQRRTPQGTFAPNPNAPPSTKPRTRKKPVDPWQPEVKLLIKPPGPSGPRRSAAEIAAEYEADQARKLQGFQQQSTGRHMNVAPTPPEAAASQATAFQQQYQTAPATQVQRPLLSLQNEQRMQQQQQPFRTVIVRNPGLTGVQGIPAARRSTIPTDRYFRAAPNARFTHPPNPPVLPNRIGTVRRPRMGSLSANGRVPIPSASQVRNAMQRGKEAPSLVPSSSQVRNALEQATNSPYNAQMQLQASRRKAGTTGGEPPTVIKKFSAPMAPSDASPRSRTVVPRRRATFPVPVVKVMEPAIEIVNDGQNSAFDRFLARRGKKRGWKAASNHGNENISYVAPMNVDADANSNIMAIVDEPAAPVMEFVPAPKRRKVAFSMSKLDGPNVRPLKKSYVLLPQNQINNYRMQTLQRLAFLSPSKLAWGIPPKNAVRPGSARSVIYGRRTMATMPNRNTVAPLRNTTIMPARNAAMLSAQNAAVQQSRKRNFLPVRNAAAAGPARNAVEMIQARPTRPIAPAPPVPPTLLPFRPEVVALTRVGSRPVGIPIHTNAKQQIVTKRPNYKPRLPPVLVSKDTWRAKPITPATVAQAVAAKKANAAKAVASGVTSGHKANGNVSIAAVQVPVPTRKANVVNSSSTAQIAVQNRNVPNVTVAGPVGISKANVPNVNTADPDTNLVMNTEMSPRPVAAAPVPQIPIPNALESLQMMKNACAKKMTVKLRISAPKPAIIPLDTVRKQREARVKESTKLLRITPFSGGTVGRIDRVCSENFAEIPANVRKEVEDSAKALGLGASALWKWKLAVSDHYCNVAQDQRENTKRDGEGDKQLNDFKEFPFDSFMKGCSA